MDKRLCGYAAVILAAMLVVPAVLRGSSLVVDTLGGEQAGRTLVIDAGHGGFDGGAVGTNGTSEQDINLSIAQKVRMLAGFFGVHTVMTRENREALEYDASRSVRENKVADIKAREQVLSNISDPVFLSIHLNKFSEAKYHGAQVFFSPNHADGRILAEKIQAALITGCDPANHRQAKQAESTIYLMKKLQCPAVIVECGFLSNPEEEQRLCQQDYHKKLAACIIYGYLQYEGGG